MTNSNRNSRITKKCQRRRNGRQMRRQRKLAEQKIIKSIDKEESTHPFHILSDCEYNKISKNNIVLQNLKFVQVQSPQLRRLTIYKIERKNVGENIQHHFNILSRTNVIDLSQVKRRFMTMTMPVSDFLSAHNSIHFHGVEPANSSGMILLSIATYCDTLEDEQNMDEVVDLFRKSRYSIVVNGKDNYHHCTMGESYGVGLVAKYIKDENGLSFGTYANKQKLQSKNDTSILNTIMDRLIYLSLKKPLDIIPNLHKNIWILGRSMKNHLKETLQKNPQMCNFGEIRSYMSSQFNINSVTHIPHTELDQSSTIIYVPQQNSFHQKYYFEFVLNHFTSIQICLKPGTSIIYTSCLLVHRQISSHMTKMSNTIRQKKIQNSSAIIPKRNANHRNNIQLQESNFINISAYFNKRLFENIKKSLSRIQLNRENET